MKIGVQIHPQATSTAAMREAWQQADAMGVDSLWVWDHFYPLYGDPDATHFECYSLLAAMAATTSPATIGALVTCKREIEADHFGVLIVYTSGAPLGGPFLERIRSRRPDVTDPSELFPVGLPALRAHISRFIDAGYTKFVLLPAADLAGQPGGITEELERVAAEVLTLEHD